MIRQFTYRKTQAGRSASSGRMGKAAMTAAAILTLFSAVAVGVGARQSPATTRQSSAPPAHLEQARELVENLRMAQLNVYGGGKREIDWQAGHAAARTVCSSFTTLLLQRAYHWSNAEIKDWLGSTNPEAFAYHDAIVDRNKFLRITHVDKIRPGDILAIKYTDHHASNNGVEDTGHVMLVAEAPQEIRAHKPKTEDTRQYVVTVIDSSASGHGPLDTRHRPDGKFTGGIGRGVLRLYSDKEGKIAGYTWSDGNNSPFYAAPERDLVAGRLKLSAGEKSEGDTPATP